MLSLVPTSRRSANLFRLMDDMERSFFDPSISGRSQFRTDISDKGDHYLLEAELPGFDKNDIKIEQDGDVLTISATHSSENEEKDKEGNFVRRERRYGSFSRSFDVAGIDSENIKAAYKNGILELNMPKAKELEPETRKIAISD